LQLQFSYFDILLIDNLPTLSLLFRHSLIPTTQIQEELEELERLERLFCSAWGPGLLSREVE
jgi:hypothetical protein